MSSDLRRVDDKDICVIANFYWNQRAGEDRRHIDQTSGDPPSRQTGRVLSPTLFNIYFEEIFVEALTKEHSNQWGIPKQHTVR